jgi:hypothetical protein
MFKIYEFITIKMHNIYWGILNFYVNPLEYLNREMYHSHGQTTRCPTTDEWIKKIWYLHTMEFYSAMKKNEILLFEGKWMELENIILSEVSQVQKTKNHMFAFICRL